MSSFGEVNDLLDDGYLNLQDVTGNVEPLPTLVPYEQYTHTMIVYQMDEPLEPFVSRLHEFTTRMAGTSSQELWTWFVQWEVEVPSELQPATKKARLAVSPGPRTPARDGRQKGPTISGFVRTLRSELFDEEDMLRILVDIVQVKSEMVPNYVEFLYQLIDFYEGDGKALKAAVRMEIPSLWLFEYHPLPIFDKTISGENMGEKLGRKKPDRVALEALTEESERLQYREPKFGLQPPIDPKDEPLPPLINIPRDNAKRRKYYAACFKNRQRAFWLLQEAGLSARQIANYKRLQTEGPKETNEMAEGNGFVNYYKEEPFAREQSMLAEQMKKLREKQTEVAISNKLALEAQLAAATQAGHILGGSGQRYLAPPLIPPTPSYIGRSSNTMTLVRRLESLRQTPARAITCMPPPVLALTKSKLFRETTATRPSKPATANPSTLPHWPWSTDDSSSDGSDADDSSIASSDSFSYYGDDIDPDLRDDDDGNGGQDGSMEVAQQQDDAHEDGHDTDVDMSPGDDEEDGEDSFDPPTGSPSTQTVAPTAPNTQVTVIQNLNAAQTHNLLRLLNPQAQQTVLQRTTAFTSATSAVEQGQGFGTSTFQQPALPNFLGGPSGNSQSGFPLQPNALNGIVPPPRLNAQFGAQFATNPTAAVPPSQKPPYGLSSQAGYGASSQRGPASNAPAITVTPASMSTAPATQVPLGFPGGMGGFLRQNLTQSSARAAPPSSLTLQSPTAGLGVPLPTIQRPNPSSSLMTPLAKLANSLSLASPYTPPTGEIPIQIYVPKIFMRANKPPDQATDCLVLGYTRPNSGVLRLTRAIFLPLGVWENTQRRVRFGRFKVLESYSPAGMHARYTAHKGILTHPEQLRTPHKSLHEKLCHVYGFMANCTDREDELTKRWRASKGPLTETARGAVWEGYGVYVDRAIEMSKEERKGALVLHSLDDPEDDSEAEYRRRRKQEIDELLEEDEAWDSVSDWDAMEE
jgi:hypothetical protein